MPGVLISFPMDQSVEGAPHPGARTWLTGQTASHSVPGSSILCASRWGGSLSARLAAGGVRERTLNERMKWASIDQQDVGHHSHLKIWADGNRVFNITFHSVSNTGVAKVG